MSYKQNKKQMNEIRIQLEVIGYMYRGIIGDFTKNETFELWDKINDGHYVQGKLSLYNNMFHIKGFEDSVSVTQDKAVKITKDIMNSDFCKK